MLKDENYMRDTTLSSAVGSTRSNKSLEISNAARKEILSTD